jgi:hypothetical protein
VNCRQYLGAYRDWQQKGPPERKTFRVMTLDFERIWVTEEEGKEIDAAIQAAKSPVSVG